jgi:hypothetical protein
MKFGPKAALGVAALAGVLALGTSAHAYVPSFTIDPDAKCTSAKIKTVGKGAAAYAGCHSKGAAGSVATDLTCLSKASTKITGAFAKLDLKPPCATLGDGGARDTDTANYAVALDTAVGHAGKCDAAKTKTVGKYIAAIMGCYAKAAAKAPGTVSNGPGSCTDKALVKMQNAINKIELKPPCSNFGLGNLAALQSAANNFIDAQTCLLAPNSAYCNPVCGNGSLEFGEACDASAGPAGSCLAVSNTSAAFTCTGSCECPCPTTIEFTGTASDPASILDTGWTGFGHRAPIISNGDTTINVSGCAGSSRPCGVCNISGPAPNGPGKLENQRCTNDNSIRCTTDAPCLGGGGTCEFFFGSNLPLAAGGVTTCVVNQFNGSISGTANVETGQASTSALLTSRVYLGIVIDNPCPRCVGDTTLNDGVLGGTCSGGARNGLTCDGNGTVANRPDFGTTSLDCPPTAGALIATLPIDLTNSTGPVTKTLTASNPTCGGEPTEKCLCDTCNNGNAETCDDNADCPDPAGPIGPICGGRRCIAGANAGAACTNNTECPTSQCARKGEPSKPSACLDDTNTVGVLDCTDTGPVDGEGECTAGPVTSNCSVASGHAQRGCGVDADCGGGIGSCESANRRCFLTGGLTGKNGTNTLVAVGAADAPMNDTSSPTLGAVFCVGATNSDSVNTAAGLPGPGRVTIKGAAVGKP